MILSKRPPLSGLRWEMFVFTGPATLRVSFAMCLRTVSEYRKRSANSAMPLVAGEDIRTPLGASRVVFGIGHFDNQRNFEAPTIGPHSPEDEAATAPEVLKAPRLLVHLSGTGRRRDSNHETLLRECRPEAARHRVTDTQSLGVAPCRTQLLLKKAAPRLSPGSGNRMTHFAEGCE
jgi:hypothetical protein